MPVPVGLIAERRVVLSLMRAGAVSADTARPLADLGWAQSRGLDRLVRAGVIRQTPASAYYLDAPALADRITARQHRVAIVLTMLLAAAGLFLWLRTGP